MAYTRIPPERVPERTPRRSRWDDDKQHRSFSQPEASHLSGQPRYGTQQPDSYAGKPLSRRRRREHSPQHLRHDRDMAKRPRTDNSKVYSEKVRNRKEAFNSAYAQVKQGVANGMFSSCMDPLKNLDRLYPQWFSRSRWTSTLSEEMGRDQYFELVKLRDICIYMSKYHGDAEKAMRFDADLLPAHYDAFEMADVYNILHLTNNILTDNGLCQQFGGQKVCLPQALRHLMWLKNSRTLDIKSRALWMDTYVRVTARMLCSRLPFPTPEEEVAARKVHLAINQIRSKCRHGYQNVEKFFIQAFHDLRDNRYNFSSLLVMACMVRLYLQEQPGQTISPDHIRQLMDTYYFAASLLIFGQGKNYPENSVAGCVEKLSGWHVFMQDQIYVYPELFQGIYQQGYSCVTNRQLDDTLIQCCVVPDKRYFQGMQHIHDGNYQEAWKCLDQLLHDPNPRIVDITHLAKCWGQIKKGNLRQAREELSYVNRDVRTIDFQACQLERLIDKNMDPVWVAPHPDGHRAILRHLGFSYINQRSEKLQNAEEQPELMDFALSTTPAAATAAKMEISDELGDLPDYNWPAFHLTDDVPDTRSDAGQCSGSSDTEVISNVDESTQTDGISNDDAITQTDIAAKDANCMTDLSFPADRRPDSDKHQQTEQIAETLALYEQCLAEAGTREESLRKKLFEVQDKNARFHSKLEHKKNIIAEQQKALTDKAASDKELQSLRKSNQQLQESIQQLQAEKIQARQQFELQLTTSFAEVEQLKTSTAQAMLEFERQKDEAITRMLERRKTSYQRELGKMVMTQFENTRMAATTFVPVQDGISTLESRLLHADQQLQLLKQTMTTCEADRQNQQQVALEALQTQHQAEIRTVKAEHAAALENLREEQMQAQAGDDRSRREVTNLLVKDMRKKHDAAITELRQKTTKIQTEYKKDIQAKDQEIFLLKQQVQTLKEQNREKQRWVDNFLSSQQEPASSLSGWPAGSFTLLPPEAMQNPCCAPLPDTTLSSPGMAMLQTAVQPPSPPISSALADLPDLTDKDFSSNNFFTSLLSRRQPGSYPPATEHS